MAGIPHISPLPDGAVSGTEPPPPSVFLDRLALRLDPRLPQFLRAKPDDVDRLRRDRSRTTWIADAVMAVVVLATAGATHVGNSDTAHHPHSTLMTVLDIGLVPVAIIVLLWRRRHPFAVVFALAVIASLAPDAGFGQLIAVYAVSAYARPAVAMVGIGAALVSVPIGAFLWLDVSGNKSFWSDFAFGVILILAAGAWGLYAGVRRELLASLRERATRAESEQQLRVDQARQAERTRIAREMHDVLAHRMSLLSVHAGALEYRPDAPPAEVAKAAGVIRATAHEALEELRTVIGVLRVGDSLAPAGSDADGALMPEPPQPTLTALPHLIEEWRAAGARIELDGGAVDADAVPAAIGRTAYRIVQEALTNAGKHAPRAKVSVLVAGAPGDELRLSITNPLAVGGTLSGPRAGIPGTGLGLVGLRERTELAGGAFAAAVDPDLQRFVVEARLPWPA